METLDEVLAHYGIKGMRWGVRKKGGSVKKASKKSGSKSKETSEDADQAAKASAKAKKSGVKALSNKELQQLNTRLNLERQYSSLTSGDRSKGAKFVSELLVGVGKSQATRLVNDQVTKAVGMAIKK